MQNRVDHLSYSIVFSVRKHFCNFFTLPGLSKLPDFVSGLTLCGSLQHVVETLVPSGNVRRKPILQQIFTDFNLTFRYLEGRGTSLPIGDPPSRPSSLLRIQSSATGCRAREPRVAGESWRPIPDSRKSLHRPRTPHRPLPYNVRALP